MGYLDEAMSTWKPPVADDLEIALPTRREPKKDAESADEALELGQHGGTAEGTPADAHSDVVSGGSGTSAEPVPQRDEPDDGEHTDSTEEEVAARATRLVEQAAAPDEAHVEVADAPEPDEEVELEQEVALEPVPQPVDVRKELAGMAGSAPRSFQKTGFSSGGVETVVVKKFPVPLVDRLRLSLAAVVGGEFAESLSAPALITAFLIAKTGVELEVDANTSVAVDVFRQSDPRLLAVEDKIDEVMDDVSQLANAMKISLKRIGNTGDIVDGLEFAMAYLVADRVAGLTTSDVDETNVDVTQKKVLTARESIRKRAKAQRSVEKQRDGRRMA